MCYPAFETVSVMPQLIPFLLHLLQLLFQVLDLLLRRNIQRELNTDIHVVDGVVTLITDSFL